VIATWTFPRRKHRFTYKQNSAYNNRVYDLKGKNLQLLTYIADENAKL
jgi:hypothetical protein